MDLIIFFILALLVCVLHRIFNNITSNFSQSHPCSNSGAKLRYQRQAHWALAIISLHMRRHDQAIREAERTISLNPNLAIGHEVLGASLHYSGRSEEALVCLGRATALDPFFPDLWLHFQAQSMFQLGRYEEAEDLLKQRMTRNPDTDSSRVLLAACYGCLGRFDDARALWQDVFRVNPSYSLEHRRSVLPYKNLEDFERVVDGLRKAGIVS